MPSWGSTRQALSRRFGESVSDSSRPVSPQRMNTRVRARPLAEDSGSEGNSGATTDVTPRRPASSSTAMALQSRPHKRFQHQGGHGHRGKPSRSGFGGGTGTSYVKHRVEKSYKKMLARSSMRSNPDMLLQLSPAQGYLTYHEITLLNSDVRALKDDWLTDTNIAFWEEYLEHEILPKYPQARIALMRPTLVALLVQARKLSDIADALPTFRNETHIFLPISDSINAGRRADTGSHWSLLLVSKVDGVAFHYDSMNDHNDYAARAAVERLSRHLRQPLQFYRILDMPQQSNSSDCGVIVCILMRHLLISRLLNTDAGQKVVMSMHGKQIDTYGGRKEMLRIVEQLRKEGERRRSTGALPLPIRSGNSPPYID